MLRAALFLLAFFTSPVVAETRLVPIAQGWAKNSVNAVVFRRNSLITHENLQYAAFYDADGIVTLAKRELGSTDWMVRKTQYRGNVRDAHNCISIMVDGAGYLHMSWDHHGHALRYCQSKEPGSLELTDKMPMTGEKESKVTYPEFYRLANGNLLFFYRDGGSGRGNLVLNHFDTESREWSQRQSLLIDGQGERNAYWQVCTSQNAIHISWVWRETGNIATNHDMGYAVSTDEGITWKKTTGEVYELPINQANAEYACKIPQNHELINTTSMCADSAGQPYIATYWRAPGTETPQYRLIYHDGSTWQKQAITERMSPFSLSGVGTKAIPISRPQIVVDNRPETSSAYMLFRDQERGSVVSIAICNDLRTGQWEIEDLTDFSVGMWEPSYDTELWKRDKQLHLYTQTVGQGDGEKTEEVAPQMVSILEWSP